MKREPNCHKVAGKFADREVIEPLAQPCPPGQLSPTLRVSFSTFSAALRNDCPTALLQRHQCSPHSDPFTANAIVGVLVELAEVELQRKVKQAGGKWNPARRLWEIHYDQAVKLGLKGRIEKPKVSDNTNRSGF